MLKYLFAIVNYIIITFISNMQVPILFKCLGILYRN